MTEKPDYMQKADESAAYHRCMRTALASTLEALDTERAAHEATKDALDQSHENGNQLVSELLDERAAHKATKAELLALRERYAAKMSVVEWAINQPVENFDGIIASLHAILPQPIADPLAFSIWKAIKRALLKDASPDHDQIGVMCIETELARHGLTITAIGGKP